MTRSESGGTTGRVTVNVRWMVVLPGVSVMRLDAALLHTGLLALPEQRAATTTRRRPVAVVVAVVNAVTRTLFPLTSVIVACARETDTPSASPVPAIVRG
jgi:hypothetical protein